MSRTINNYTRTVLELIRSKCGIIYLMLVAFRVSNTKFPAIVGVVVRACNFLQEVPWGVIVLTRIDAILFLLTEYRWTREKDTGTIADCINFHSAAMIERPLWDAKLHFPGSKLSYRRKPCFAGDVHLCAETKHKRPRRLRRNRTSSKLPVLTNDKTYYV